MRKVLFLVALTPLLFQACKKSSNNSKKGCTYSAAANYNAEAEEDDGSCEFKGCTDATASNFNSSAIEDDGTCTYAWSQYVGTYDIPENSDEYMDAHVSKITKGPSGNEIIISNFRNKNENMRATIDGNEFSFSDVVDGAGYIGTGYIVDGVVTLDMNACEDYNYPDDCVEANYQMILTPQ